MVFSILSKISFSKILGTLSDDSRDDEKIA